MKIEREAPMSIVVWIFFPVIERLATTIDGLTVLSVYLPL